MRKLVSYVTKLGTGGIIFESTLKYVELSLTDEFILPIGGRPVLLQTNQVLALTFSISLNFPGLKKTELC